MTAITVTSRTILAHRGRYCLQSSLAAAVGPVSDEPFPMADLLERHLDLEDVLWVLGCHSEYDHLWRKFAVWCARQAEHLMTDNRCLDALDVAWRYSEGEASLEDMKRAYNKIESVKKEILATPAGKRAGQSASVFDCPIEYMAASLASIVLTPHGGAAAASEAYVQLAKTIAAHAAMGAPKHKRDGAWQASFPETKEKLSAKLGEIFDAGEWVEDVAHEPASPTPGP